MASVIANANRAKDTEPFEISDFLLAWDPEDQAASRDPSPEQLLGLVRGIHGALGGKRQQEPEAEGAPSRPPSPSSQSE